MADTPKIHYHIGDLPKGLSFPDGIAVDTETLGLKTHRDRLCVVQLSGGDGVAHVVQMRRDYDAPVLRGLLGDPAVLKIMHFGRFDIAALYHWLGVLATPVYCTKIASRISRTNTDSHGLKGLCKDLLNVDLSKQQQTSDWGTETLTQEQLDYAASDVLYLHRLKGILDGLLDREGRTDLARACFEFLPHRALLDLAGWDDTDIFAHR